MALVRIKQKFQVTIPARLRAALHLKEGELLEATTDGATIVLTPKTVVDRADVAAAVSEGLEDARQGRTVGPFATTRAFRKFRGTKAYKTFVASE
jgi:AbrB family looped-hinge helix DNA binding protein